MTLWPALPIAIPLLAAALVAATQRWLPRPVPDALAWLAAAAQAAVSLGLLASAWHAPFVYWMGGWKAEGGMAMGIGFYVDGASCMLAALAGVLTMGAFTYAWRYFETPQALFHVLMLVFSGAMAGFALSGDVFTMFVCFELMGIAAYALAGFHSEEKGPVQGAFNFAMINSLGAFMMLWGIGLLYGRYGALNMAQLGLAVAASPADALVMAALGLLLGGLFVKGAIVPFHFWLPDAHAVAPAPVSALFSGVMVELGLYGAARLLWVVFHGPLGAHAHGLQLVLVAAGAITAVVGGALCLMQHHLKRLLAYSTVSHAGLMLMGVALLSADGLAGVGVYLVGHGLVKATLFLSAGIVLNLTGSVNELELHGRGKRLVGTSVLFMLAGLALAGLPPFGTALGKSLLEEAAPHGAMSWVGWLAMAASAVTAAAVLRAGARIFFGLGPLPEPPAGSADRLDEQRTEGPEEAAGTPWLMALPAAVLLVLALAVGLWPGLPGAALVVAAHFTDAADYTARVLPQVAPAPAPVSPGQPGHLDWLKSCLPVVAAVALAALMLTRGPARRLADALRPVASVLRAAHSGHVGDYAAWAAIGGAALSSALLLTLR